VVAGRNDAEVQSRERRRVPAANRGFGLSGCSSDGQDRARSWAANRRPSSSPRRQALATLPRSPTRWSSPGVAARMAAHQEHRHPIGYLVAHSPHPALDELLADHHATILSFVGWIDRSWAANGSPIRTASFRTWVWRPATRAAGLEGVRIHDLRHTAVALWIAAGAGPREVATRAGHTSVSFTLDRYGHLYPEADRALRDRLDRLHEAASDD
jgi:Phage integrase family